MNVDVIKGMSKYVKNVEQFITYCPICKECKLEICELIYEVPMLGDLLIVSMRCKHCGFKTYDIECVKEKYEGKIYELEVRDVNDLNTLILKSRYARIYIPELDVEILPGSMSEYIVTTVEGILYRILEIAEFCYRSEPDSEKLRRINEIKEAIEGKKRITLIIEDPKGLSRIFSSEVKIKPLFRGDVKSHQEEGDEGKQEVQCQ